MLPSYYSSAFPTLEMVATPSPSAKRARLMITAPTRQQLAATIIPVKSRAKRSPSAGGNHHHMAAQHHRKQKSPPQLQQLQQQQQQIPYQQAQQTSQPPLPLPTASSSQLQHPEDQVVVISQLKTYSNPDILICGNCREMFGELSEMVQHKKTYCKVRFTCKCDTNSSTTTEKSVTNNNNKVTLLCVQCKESFESAWDLVVHAQAEHMINVYELGVQNSKFSTADFGTLENGFERNQIENNSKEDDTDDSDENTTVSEKSFKDIVSFFGDINKAGKTLSQLHESASI